MAFPAVHDWHRKTSHQMTPAAAFRRLAHSRRPRLIFTTAECLMGIHVRKALFKIRRRLNIIPREMLYEHIRLLYRHKSERGIVVTPATSAIIIEGHYFLLFITDCKLCFITSPT